MGGETNAPCQKMENTMPLKPYLFGGVAAAALCGLVVAMPAIVNPANAQPASSSMSQPVPQASAPLESIPNPSAKLANANVITSDGQKVGTVKQVVVDQTGMAKAVAVKLTTGTNKTVAIHATELNFDQNRNVLISTLNVDQINALPEASST
jgi:sporulation protein YlmC with PRC-barrel domain